MWYNPCRKNVIQKIILKCKVFVMNTTGTTKLNMSLLYLSILCGIATGGCVFLFVIRFSKWAYGIATRNPIYLLAFFAGLILIGLCIYFILKFEPQIKGGGIPTAVKFIREGKSFNVIKNIILIPISALITFLSGVPLGNEGPSVQLGCAIGQGVSKIKSKKIGENERYIMTGGACAGFGVATGAPISSILFSLEEVRGKFSIGMIVSVGISTLFATLTNRFLGYVLGVDCVLFHIDNNLTLPLKYVWMSLLVGAVSGLCAILFFALCKLYEKLEQKGVGKIKLWIRIEIILIISGVLGLLSQMYIGTGHDIAHNLLEGENIGLTLLVSALILRMIMLLVANKTGITGGLFVPTLAMGALIGGILACLLTMGNVLPVEYSFLLVIMGMTAFLGSRGKMPLVAFCFSLEALNGYRNIIPIALSVATAYGVLKLFECVKVKKKQHIEM